QESQDIEPPRRAPAPPEPFVDAQVFAPPGEHHARVAVGKTRAPAAAPIVLLPADQAEGGRIVGAEDRVDELIVAQPTERGSALGKNRPYLFDADTIEPAVR